ncbi:MAG: ABC transporter ATP-binding protein [Gammaproteobacteria bacterium]|nr:ABC transporter ATP-binding protein [Gammaproteobacteria bacterium]
MATDSLSARPAAPVAKSTPSGFGLEVRDVLLTYRTRTEPISALKDLTLSVAPGEFVSVIGPSGCGKSTLLKLVAGLLPLSSGEIVLGDERVDGPRREVGIVFQSPTLLPWKTVLDNVMVPARALGLETAPSRAKALELLRLVGLEKFASNYPGELSGGMQQRVGLIRGLIHDPEFLLMDEPLAALDTMTRETMMLELQRIWMFDRKSVLFVTHNITEAVFLSDRIIILSERPGRVVNELAVDFERPRDLQTMALPRFTEICNELRMHFHEIVSDK